MKRILLTLTLCAIAASSVQADKSLAGRACRSVHLGYSGPQGTAFYNEAKVTQSADGSYFMVCGWNTGYFGIQEIRNGRKVVIFSVWDNHRGNDPNAVPEDVQVGILHEGEGVKVSRFGGEGTGGKSMFDYDWQIGQTYRFLVTARPNGQRTEYAGYFYLPEKQQWKHLVTFSTLTGGKHLGGYYSFVEDFRRNGESTKHAREALYTNGWVRDVSGAWRPLIEAKFTADSNPAMTIDAGVRDRWFYLVTGGQTENTGTKLWQKITRPVQAGSTPPADLPGIK
ncbi:DUF3472 domain-containing protein [Planctomycetales bacterium ZRK34]|nr:DUF3472 domain-containing protein [Planctomycetales bacterium ZRK34]